MRTEDPVIPAPLTVIPAQAGIQSFLLVWAPACAGVTDLCGSINN